MTREHTIDHHELTMLTAQVAHVANLAPDFDGFDPYGSTMSVAFACADLLHQRGDEVPDEWEYKPGLGAEDEEHPLFEDFESPYLRMMGHAALALARTCDQLDLSY